jgi:hypothetical protein
MHKFILKKIVSEITVHSGRRKLYLKWEELGDYINLHCDWSNLGHAIGGGQ